MGRCRELTTICYVIILSEFNVFPPLLILLIIILLWPRPHALLRCYSAICTQPAEDLREKNIYINFYFQTHNEKMTGPDGADPQLTSLTLLDCVLVHPGFLRTLSPNTIWCNYLNATLQIKKCTGLYFLRARLEKPRAESPAAEHINADCKGSDWNLLFFPPFFFFNLQSSWQTRKSH